MRKIKFRARNANTPACWIYGYFVVVRGNCYIENDEGRFKVIAGSEAQYTGLKDYESKEIYEGDIVTFDGLVTADNSFGIEPNGYIYDKNSVHSVIWNSKLCCWDLNFKNDEEWKYRRDTRNLFIGNTEEDKDKNGTSLCKVIGNIYENPELLEKDKRTSKVVTEGLVTEDEVAVRINESPVSCIFRFDDFNEFVGKKVRVIIEEV